MILEADDKFSPYLQEKHSFYINCITMFSYLKLKELDYSVYISCQILRQKITSKSVHELLQVIQPDLNLKRLESRNFQKIRFSLDKLTNLGFLVKPKKTNQYFLNSTEKSSSRLFDKIKYKYWTEKNYKLVNNYNSCLTYTLEDLLKRTEKSIKNFFIAEFLNTYFRISFTTWSQLKYNFCLTRYEINKIKTLDKHTVNISYDSMTHSAVKYHTKNNYEIGNVFTLWDKPRCGYKVTCHIADKLRISRKEISPESRQHGFVSSSLSKGIFPSFLDPKWENFFLKRSNDYFVYKVGQEVDRASEKNIGEFKEFKWKKMSKEDKKYYDRVTRLNWKKKFKYFKNPRQIDIYSPY